MADSSRNLAGYPRFYSAAYSSGLKQFRSEFSTEHAICSVELLRQLFNSDTPDGQKVAKHLLMTIAILTQLNGGDQYRQIVRSNATPSWRISNRQLTNHMHLFLDFQQKNPNHSAD